MESRSAVIASLRQRNTWHLYAYLLVPCFHLISCCTLQGQTAIFNLSICVDLCFCLSSAPRVLTKVPGPFPAFFRTWGIQVTSHLDNLLLKDISLLQLSANVHKTFLGLATGDISGDCRSYCKAHLLTRMAKPRPHKTVQLLQAFQYRTSHM